MLYITKGHQVLNGKGTGAFGVKGLNGLPFDEAKEAAKFVNDLNNFLFKWHKVVVKTDELHWSLSSVIGWLTKVVTTNDIAIEFHFNAGVSVATGVETFIPDSWNLAELHLASDITKVIANTLGLKIRSGSLKEKQNVLGVKIESESQHPRIGFLNKPYRAANILVEICFITNEKDVKAYRDNYWKLVENVGNEIIKHYKP